MGPQAAGQLAIGSDISSFRFWLGRLPSSLALFLTRSQSAHVLQSGNDISIRYRIFALFFLSSTTFHFFGTRHEYFPYEDVAKSGRFHHEWCISHSSRLPCIKCILPPFVPPRTPTVPELSLPGPDETHSTFSESAGKRSRLAAQPRPTTRSLAVQGLHPC